MPDTNVIAELNNARAKLADALSKIPSAGPVNFPNDYFSVREALEACAQCFDCISRHYDRQD